MAENAAVVLQRETDSDRSVVQTEPLIIISGHNIKGREGVNSHRIQRRALAGRIRTTGNRA